MIRAILGAALGAAASAAALFLFTLPAPGIALEMDVSPPRPLASGLYSVERYQDETYAWTHPLATFTFRGVDRGAEWRCVARLRGARPPDRPPVEVTMSVDGIAAVRRVVGNTYEDVEVTAPPGSGSSLSVTIGAAPAWVPPSDPRELGVQLDRLACEPASRVWPPRAALITAMIGGAGFGALFGILSGGIAALVTAAVAFGLAFGWVLQSGFGMYVQTYLDWIPPLTAWIVVPLAVAGAWRRQRLSGAARFVLAFSAAVLFLKLVTLLHPAKELIDALFHAHRLGWVLGGRYFFTQPMPGGVQFPYAIGLYLTAVPFAGLVRDHVALLRIVILVFEAVAAGLLYVVVVRAWRDRLTAAGAVVFCHLAPLPYVVIGNANQTFVFGQATSVIAVAIAAVLTFRAKNVPALALLFAATALSFLSHVGIFPLLGVTLFSLGVLYWRLGGDDARASGPGIIAVAVLAAVFAVGSYYAHFPEVYRTLDRVRSAQSAPAPAAGAEARPAPQPLTLTERATRAVSLGVRALDWPLLLLAVSGLWLVVRSPRDRLTLTLAAWGISFLVFVAFRVVAPVDARLQRYADEFIDRVYYATLPAIAILAARATASGWRAGSFWRVAVCVAAAGAVFVGVRQWMDWIR